MFFGSEVTRQADDVTTDLTASALTLKSAIRQPAKLNAAVIHMADRGSIRALDSRPPP
jgi:hypothetical protein